MALSASFANFFNIYVHNYNLEAGRFSQYNYKGLLYVNRSSSICDLTYKENHNENNRNY